MKRASAKVLSVFLSLMMVFTLLPAAAMAAGSDLDELPTVAYVFDTNHKDGGILQGTAAIETEFSVIKPAAPARAGYAFEGWYTNAAGTGEAVKDTDKILEDTTYFAGWKANDLTVTFDSKGGTAVASFPGKYDGLVTKPADPVKAGYTFAGWKNGDVVWNFATDTLKANLTLTAAWNGAGPGASTFTVSFDRNDGSGLYDQSAVLSGEKASKPATDPARAGYTFAGWYKESSGTTAVNFNDPIAAPTTYFAKWTAIAYQVTYEENGGTPVVDAKITYNGNAPRTIADLPAVTTVKANVVFGGWYYDADLTKAAAPADKITSDITLHARWLQNVAVKFHANNGAANDLVADRMYTEGSTIPAVDAAAIAIAPRAGYANSGKWYTDQALTTEFVFGTSKVVPGLELYLKWTANSDYTVTFDSKGGSPVASASVSATGERTVAKPANPTRTGYDFVKWTNGGADFAFTGEKDATKISGNVTLVANWTKKGEIRVSFLADGKIFDAKDYAQGETYAQPATNPVKTGSTFVAWVNADSGKKFAEETSHKVGSVNVEYNALFSADKYTVTFASDLGITPAAQSNLAYGASVAVPTAPEALGYAFDGWYNGSAKWDFTKDTIKGNLTLTAKWVKTYTVKINDTDAAGLQADALWTAATITVREGATLTAPDFDAIAGQQNPTMADNTFVSWGKDAPGGSTWLFGQNGTKVTSDVTLYARFAKNQDTITFYPRNGGAPVVKKVNFDTASVDVADVALGGYTFKGWADAAADTTADYADVAASTITVPVDIAAGDQSFYAIFDEVTGANLAVTFRAGYDATSGDASENIVSRQSVAPGTAVALPTITRTGYDLVEWVEDADQDGVADVGEATVAGTSLTITVDKDYAAKWAAKSYTVSFNAMGGTAIANHQTVAFGGKATAPVTDPTRVGYAFSGWYEDSTGTKAFDFANKAITGDTVIFAKWTKEYSVSFVVDSVIKTVTVLDGATLANKSVAAADAPVDPAKVGYTFDGWFTAATGGTLFLDNGVATSTKVTGDLFVYAQFIADPAAQYTVTFNSAGGSYVEDQTVADGEYAAKPADPKLPGKTFKFWSTDGTAAFDFSKPITGNVALTAYYADDVAVQIYSLDNDILAVADYTVAYNSTIAVPADPAISDTYKWNGKWFTDSGRTAPFDPAKALLVNVTLFPGRESTTKRTVEFAVNGATEATGTATLHLMAGDKVAEPTVSRTGYLLDGWYVINADSTIGAKWDFNTNVVGDNNLKLAAKWVYALTVTFNANYTDGSVTTLKSMYNRTIAQPADPTRKGYAFKGWYTDQACTHQWYFDSDKLQRNTTLFAKWNEVVITLAPYNTAATNQDVVVSASTNEGTLNTPYHTFKANGSFTFIAKDAAGNELQRKTVTIANIDKVAPVITIASYNTKPTNKDLVVKASTNEGKLNTATYTFKANGSYTFVATDAAGNVTRKTVTITNIDKTAPVIKLASYTTTWTNKSVVVKASTNEGKLNAASHTFTANGSYTFVATDAAGNVTRKTVTIKNIDKTKPVLSVKTSAGKTVKNGATVKGYDLKVKYTEANLLTKTVTLNGKKVSWSSTGVFKKHGTYVFTLKDKAGNVTTFKVVLK